MFHLIKIKGFQKITYVLHTASRIERGGRKRQRVIAKYTDTAITEAKGILLIRQQLRQPFQLGNFSLQAINLRVNLI